MKTNKQTEEERRLMEKIIDLYGLYEIDYDEINNQISISKNDRKQ